MPEAGGEEVYTHRQPKTSIRGRDYHWGTRWWLSESRDTDPYTGSFYDLLTNLKELYEPLWEDLIAQCKKHGIRIGSIWTADAANLGASGVVNEELLGNDRKHI